MEMISIYRRKPITMTGYLFLVALFLDFCGVGNSLNCHSCEYDTIMIKERQFCNPIVQRCSIDLDETFCAVANVSKFGRQGVRKGCASYELCGDPELKCEIAVQKGEFDYCDVACCNEELCNADNYVDPSNTKTWNTDSSLAGPKNTKRIPSKNKAGRLLQSECITLYLIVAFLSIW